MPINLSRKLKTAPRRQLLPSGVFIRNSFFSSSFVCLHFESARCAFPAKSEPEVAPSWAEGVSTSRGVHSARAVTLAAVLTPATAWGPMKQVLEHNELSQAPARPGPCTAPAEKGGGEKEFQDVLRKTKAQSRTNVFSSTCSVYLCFLQR